MYIALLPTQLSISILHVKIKLHGMVKVVVEFRVTPVLEYTLKKPSNTSG